ncbi:MAG: ABC transporter ATP-binding protein/permease [Clostridiales bacterium]|jgi:ABC-type multidrug transport system fused ATPase/permease subunit|nr:ABC transporter ATP-binding protein/permease [Clostridiales bacterium]
MTRAKNIVSLIRSMRQYGGEMLLTILSSVFKNFSMIGAAVSTSLIVGLAMERNLSEHFTALLALLLSCVALRALLYFGEMYFAHDVAFRVIRDFRIALFKKVEEIIPAAWPHTGNLGQTLVSDVEVLELFLAHTFAAFIVAAAVTVTLLAVLVRISAALAAMMIVFALILGFVPYIMKKCADAQGYDVREKLSIANNSTIEGIQGLRELIAAGATERYKEQNREHMRQLHDAQLRYGKRQGIESLLTQISLGCFTVAVSGAAAGLVASGSLDFAVYPVCVVLAAMLFTPVMEAVNVAQSLGLVFAAANRIQSVLSTDPSVRDSGTDESGADESGADERAETDVYEVEFDHVSFRYAEADVLREVSFKINQGEMVALAGHSGAGKTSCANLLLRYWDAQSGAVKIGGKDVRSLTLHSLRETVSAVPQETYLFHDTIRENIRLGRPNASDEEITAAAKAARAHEFISKLPNGYDTVCGERGASLSGGERQRIAIARVLLKNTPIVVFDEAVSNLDTENERYIQETLRNQLKGRTILIVAHRLSTIMSADRVVMIQNGQASGAPRR